MSCFIQIAGNIPLCPGDAVQATKDLGLLDDITINEESDPVYTAEDADGEEDNEW